MDLIGHTRIKCVGTYQSCMAYSDRFISHVSYAPPLLIGQSGEAYARLAIEADGSMLFGDGTGPFDTTLRRHIARKVQWDPPPIQPGKTAVKVVVRPQSTTLHPFLWLLWIYQAI